MEYYISQLINGVCQGSIYALMAIGYSVVVGMTNLVTFAFGEVIMVGAFAAYYTFGFFGNNLLLGILASFAASFFVGAFVYKLCYEKFLNAPRYIAMVCTIGTSMFLKNLAQAVFGPNKKPMLNVIENKFFGSGVLSISLLQIVILLVVVVASAVLAIVFNKTKLGISFRAVSQDKTASYMVGINVKKTILYGNCIGCGLGGIAGVLISIYYQTLQATMGDVFGIKAFSSSVLGGLTDIRFSAVGGVLIGVIENLGIAFTSASYRNIFAFIFMLLVLLVKPTGLGNKRGDK